MRAQRAAWERARAAWDAARQRQQPERRWYGWQTLAVDASSIALWIGGAETSSWGSKRALITVGFLGYLLGAPFVHGAHAHWGKAGASFAFRAGATLLAIAGAAGCDTFFSDRRCDGGYEALLVLGALGIPAAIVVDAAVIAREDVPPKDGARLQVVPWLAKHGGGGGLAVGGVF